MRLNFYRLILLLICLNFSSLFAQETPKQAAIPTKQQTKLDSTVFDSTKLAQTEAKTEPNQNMSSDGNITIGNLIALGVGLILLAGLFFNIYVRRKSVRHAQEIEQVKLEVKEEYEKKLEQQRLERLKNEERAKREVADERAQIKQQQKTKTAEQRYRDALQEELGSIKILGSPDIESVPVNLLDAFVSLDLSETWRSESRFYSEKLKQPGADEKHTNPENVLKRAFKNYRLLLLIGDPGSGKTTLMKYYAISCLQGQEYKKFGFKERVLPLYFPLRELEPKDKAPDSLPENLARWTKSATWGSANGSASGSTTLVPV